MDKMQDFGSEKKLLLCTDILIFFKILIQDLKIWEAAIILSPPLSKRNDEAVHKSNLSLELFCRIHFFDILALFKYIPK